MKKQLALVVRGGFLGRGQGSVYRTTGVAATAKLSGALASIKLCQKRRHFHYRQCTGGDQNSFCEG